MGSGMSLIVPGLYVGSFRDARDQKQLNENKITHVVSVHDNAKVLDSDRTYLCITISDMEDTDIAAHFHAVVDFIHSARSNNGNVLVHCLAGVSRSVTCTVAYLMTVTDLGWQECLAAVRGARREANPNLGFKKQLRIYEETLLNAERLRLKNTYHAISSRCLDDETALKKLIAKHQRWVTDGDTYQEQQEAKIVERLAKQAVGKTNDTDESRKPVSADRDILKCGSGSVEKPPVSFQLNGHVVLNGVNGDCAERNVNKSDD